MLNRAHPTLCMCVEIRAKGRKADHLNALPSQTGPELPGELGISVHDDLALALQESVICTGEEASPRLLGLVPGCGLVAVSLQNILNRLVTDPDVDVLECPTNLLCTPSWVLSTKLQYEGLSLCPQSGATRPTPLTRAIVLASNEPSIPAQHRAGPSHQTHLLTRLWG